MKDTTIYKEKLTSEHAELVTELTALGLHNPEVPEDWIPLPPDPALTEADENVVADRSEEWLETRGTTDALEARYNNVVRALAKLDVGTYGICEICGTEIETARLDANAAARTCIAHLAEEVTLPR